MSKIAFDVSKIAETNNGYLTIPSDTVALLNSLQSKKHKVYFIADRSSMPYCQDSLGVVRLLMSSGVLYDGVVSLPTHAGFDYWLHRWGIDSFYHDNAESVEEFCSKF